MNQNIKKNGYSLEESLNILKAYSISSYPETFTLTAILKPSGGSKKQKKINISDKISLPHPIIREYKILAITEESQLEEVKKDLKGLDNVNIYSESIVDEILKNPSIILESNYEYCVASMKLASSLKKIDHILSKKKLMPTRKNSCLTKNITQKISEITRRLTSYKTDRYNCIHLSIGNTNFELKEIEENINIVTESILKQKLGMAQKDQFNSRFYINSTMGPSLPITL